MKYLLIIIIVIQTFQFHTVFSQISDNFSDENFTESPIWIGETINFIINTENQLQLNAPAEAGQTYLSISSEIINNAEWSFYVKLQFNPSSNNYLDVYLVSDHENLKEPLKGYFVRIGNTQDEVSLYKQSGEKSTSVKIIDGTDDRVEASLVELNIKVTKNHENSWELFVDTNLDKNYISEGIVVDGTHRYSLYFGIKCTFTSTRSKLFFFDNLAITGESNKDTEPPEIDSLLVISDSTLQINFTETISSISANDVNNYIISENIGNPNAVELPYDSVALLSFQKKFEDKTNHQLVVSGIKDLFSNIMDSYTSNFMYRAPYIIGFGDVIITEIMADPTPEVDLPEYEYLEIFNPHTEAFDLKQAKLIVGNDTTTIPDLTINPNEYIILCQHAAVGPLERYGRTIKVTNWPSLNNRGEAIVLLNQYDELVFSLDYDDSWYQSIEKDDGGWSLEMIDADYPCKDRANWIASPDPSGGTPGKENASKEETIDILGPTVTRIISQSNSSVIVYLNEKIAPQEISIENISVQPELEIKKVLLHSPKLTSIAIDFGNPILPKTIYELTIKNLHDCVGNIRKETSSSFVLPEVADTLDLIINEILFNPLPGGVDFVELYNQSEKYIDLNSLQIGNADTKPITKDHFIIEPKQFLVLTEDPEVLSNHYPGLEMDNIFEIDDLPPFNDDEGNVILMNEVGDSIDFFQYRDEYHSGFLRDTEGVSLERISFEGQTNNPNNWQSAASTSGFATPGKMNSQYLASIIDSEEVIIEPLVFIPGNNGFHDFTTIKCRFATSGNMASIKIADATGRLIKTIISHKSIGAEEDFKWEGLDDNGQEVRMGYYIIYLEIYNSTGVKKIYRKKVVVGGRL